MSLSFCTPCRSWLCFLSFKNWGLQTLFTMMQRLVHAAKLGIGSKHWNICKRHRSTGYSQIILHISLHSVPVGTLRNGRRPCSCPSLLSNNVGWSLWAVCSFSVLVLWVCWHFEIWKSGASKFAFSRLLSGAKGLDVASYNAVIIALEKVAWERSLDLLKAMDRVQVGQRAKVIFVFFSFHRRASKWGRNGGTGILAGGDRCQQSGRCHSRVQECRGVAASRGFATAGRTSEAAWHTDAQCINGGLCAECHVGGGCIPTGRLKHEEGGVERVASFHVFSRRMVSNYICICIYYFFKLVL